MKKFSEIVQSVLVERKIRKVVPPAQYGQVVKSPYEDKGKKKIHTYFAFKDWKKAEQYLARMGVDDTPKIDLIDGQSGEVLMQPGETKRAKLKKSGKIDIHKKYQDAMSGPWLYSYTKNDRGYWDDEWRFNDFYNVIEAPVSKVVDDVEMMRQADYDVDTVYPSKIKRKDGRPFTEYDVDNIEYYMNMWHNTSGPGNIELWPRQAQVGQRVLALDPVFT
jgi:hypothetical protein